MPTDPFTAALVEHTAGVLWPDEPRKWPGGTLALQALIDEDRKRRDAALRALVKRWRAEADRAERLADGEWTPSTDDSLTRLCVRIIRQRADELAKILEGRE